MYRSKEGISGFGRTDERTDGQPENIMPPAPKGGGIKRKIPFVYFFSCEVMPLFPGYANDKTTVKYTVKTRLTVTAE